MLLLIAGSSFVSDVAAAELNPQTAQAYGAYLKAAKTAFLARVRGSAPPLKDGEIVARPVRDDGIIHVPGGLIHHWTRPLFSPA